MQAKKFYRRYPEHQYEVIFLYWGEQHGHIRAIYMLYTYPTASTKSNAIKNGLSILEKQYGQKPDLEKISVFKVNAV